MQSTDEARKSCIRVTDFVMALRDFCAAAELRLMQLETVLTPHVTFS